MKKSTKPREPSNAPLREIPDSVSRRHPIGRRVWAGVLTHHRGEVDPPDASFRVRTFTPGDGPEASQEEEGGDLHGDERTTRYSRGPRPRTALQIATTRTSPGPLTR
jgi:hypothetical protein